MPIIQSAIKRVRSSEKRRKLNSITKNKFRELSKELMVLVDANKMAEAQKLYPRVQKAIDLAAKKHILPRNNADRKKARLAKLVFPSAAKVAKVAAEKPVVKKKAVNN